MTTDQQPEQELIDVAVLDDDRDFLTYIEDLLSDEGQYAVRVFERAEELFEAAEERRPEIVLLDMKMGRTHGEEVLEKLMQRWPELCVIIVTGYPSLEDMRATFKKNVFDYLAKPFTLNQLRQVLANAAERYGLGRALTGRLREKLGQRIRVLRAERGWSLKELAAATRLSVSQISSIERGANLPSMESLLAISRAFGLKPSQILASIEF
ncbi:MAG: response regulator [Acidobacteriota bacterium]